MVQNVGGPWFESRPSHSEHLKLVRVPSLLDIEYLKGYRTDKQPPVGIYGDEEIPP